MPQGFSYRFRRPLNSPEFRGARKREYDRSVENGMIIERDVQVPTRFGYSIYVDVFRPADESRRAPPLIAWTPYGKHNPAPLAKIYPASGVAQDWCSDYTIFEAPDPQYWVPRGYVVITADVPGLWYANTRALLCAPEEAQAFYDLVEWAGVQSWSNGKVGLSGVSYLTVMQWRVAELHPPHLAAINPWEGWTDTYREVVRHGGIPETHFWPYIQVRWGASDHEIEDLWAEAQEHPFLDEYWASKAAQLARIEVPAYVVASWSDHGLHSRGTLEGFKKISSTEKWLEVHGRKKWAYYYQPDSVARQQAFFDRFLKGEDSEVMRWPKIRVEVRQRYCQGELRTANGWPVPDTQYRKLYLDANDCALKTRPVPRSSVATYDPLDQRGEARFDFTFERTTELIGHMKLRAFVSAEGSDDLDLFVTIQKLDRAGRLVGFAHYATFEDGPVALGWLRVSHRELDASASTEFQPVLAHRRELKLAPGEVVPVDVEVLPSGTHFEAGETLRLLIRGRDLYEYPKPMVAMHHEDTVNRGRHCVHCGGDTESYLLVPVVHEK